MKQWHPKDPRVFFPEWPFSTSPALTQTEQSFHAGTTASYHKQKQYQHKCLHEQYKCLQIWHSMSQARPLLPWSHVAVAMAIEFPDESCPQMRGLRHRNRSDSLCMLTAVHLPTNLSAVGFRIRTFPFLFPPRATRTRDPNESAHVRLQTESGFDFIP